MSCVLCLAFLALSWGYPAYKTYQVIKENDYDEQWISYWMIFGVLTFLEHTILYYLTGNYVWEILKAIFVAWLVHPDFKGAEFINENFSGQVYFPLENILKSTPVW
eukprot:CAMPEP_0168316902 /NCGR_PEP_ID=MMETSP0210-20121227/20582_1 /TAXON_ID=40633 /ORGANISM="Condylostoma magnum, Strain COL2" /LENGTH=105 /DNA_ID=CAMNT_0008307277 /DNA_START=12 /DNA_END=326 /DNA_ORIENTATION=+